MKLLLLALLTCIGAQDSQRHSTLFGRENLVAWCIVPFDAKRRAPAERAAMVKRLGLRKIAYDWRKEHVPTFEEEIRQYKNHGLEFFAFWSWHDALAPLIEKYGIRPQIWQTAPSPQGKTRQQRIEAAAQRLLPLVHRSRELGLKLGLYNHGGWGGEPVNLVAVCEHLRRKHDAAHVGIVYNFHHGHGHIKDFAVSLQRMQPYLICLNLNGMADADSVAKGEDKILPIGSGEYERRMIEILLESGYSGPIGILDHRQELDAEESLRQNLDGLESLLRRIGTGSVKGRSKTPSR